MSDTTRLIPPADNSSGDEQSTRRLTPHNDDPPLLCPRCQGVMVPTRFWSFDVGAPRQKQFVAMTLADPPYDHTASFDCSAFSCIDCGYSELYADPAGLRARLGSQSDDTHSRAQGKLRSQR